MYREILTSLSMDIFLVQLSSSGDMHLCIEYCLDVSIRWNPSSRVYILTADNKLHEYLASRFASFANFLPILLSSEFMEKAISDVENILHYDGCGEKWFIAITLARHIIVKRFIDDFLEYSPAYFLVSDTDIAHFYDYSEFSLVPEPGQYIARGINHSYCAVWSKAAFDKFADLSFMREFFQWAKSNGSRSNDMYFLEWLASNAGHVQWINNPVEFGFPIDHLYLFLVASGLWIDLLDIDPLESMRAFPGHPWTSLEIQQKFVSMFWRALFIFVNDNCSEGLPGLRLNKGLLRHGLNRIADYNLDVCPAVKAAHQSYVATRLLDNPLPRIPLIHFNGSAKRFVAEFSQLGPGRS